MPVVTVNLSVPQAQRVVDALIARRAADPNSVPITVAGFLKEQLIVLVENFEKADRELKASTEYQRIIKSAVDFNIV